jgi:hypothetical protein
MASNDNKRKYADDAEEEDDVGFQGHTINVIMPVDNRKHNSDGH